MKKIFTLLFCVAAIAFAANANETNNNDELIMKCVNVVLGVEAPSTNLNGMNLDVNNDGRIDVNDVTLLITQKLEQKKAQANNDKIDVNELIDKTLNTNNRKPSISDVNQAIDHNLKNENE